MREVLTLDGLWDFELDEQGIGFEEQWYRAEKKLSAAIRVPGAWQAQGEQLHRDGVGWYRRDFEVPADWQGRRLRLRVGRAVRYTTAYVNGVCVGRHEGLSTPFWFDISQALKPGHRNTLTLAVDNRPQAGKTLQGCLTFTGNWGGIAGSVSLEATPHVYIGNVFVLPDVFRGQATFRVTVTNTLAREMRGNVEVAVSPAGGPSAQQGWGQATLHVVPGNHAVVEITVPLQNPHPWSPDDPFLYQARVRLTSDGDAADQLEVRFGLRNITVEGNRLLLNGNPIFLAGYGDNNVEPLTGLPPNDREIYRRRLLTMKACGFNYVRHHSWVPYEEYLEVADEVGMLVQPEAPLIYGSFLKDNAAAALAEFERIVCAYRNHPCVAFWCGGNEWKYGPLWYRRAKQLDPTRPVNLSDGGWDHDRDIRAFPTDVSTAVWRLEEFHPNPYIVPGSARDEHTRIYPTLGHEYGQYGFSLPDLGELPAFTGVQRPRTYERLLAQLQGLGLLDRYPVAMRNSRRLLNDLRKACMEMAHQKGLRGYSYWLGVDVPQWDDTCSPEGVLTWQWQPKDFRPADMQEYNGQTVLLINRHPSQRTFFCGERVPIEISVSHYGAADIRKGTWRWWWEQGERRSSSRSRPVPRCARGEITRLGTAEVGSPDGRASKVMLVVELWQGDRRVAANRWPLWFFPRERLTSWSRPIAYEEGPCRLVERYPFLRVMDPSWSDERRAEVVAECGLLVTYYLDDMALDYLESGGRVLLLSRDAFKRQRWMQFWANRNFTSFGTVVERHPVFDRLPHESYCDLGFFGLLEGAYWVPWECLPAGVTPLVWAVHGSRAFEKQEHDRNMFASFAAWEAWVSRGRLFATTLEFVWPRPENVYLLDQLLRYTLSEDFQPIARISRQELEAVIVKPSAAGLGDLDYKDLAPLP